MVELVFQTVHYVMAEAAVALERQAETQIRQKLETEGLV
jgi:hypothetical protein